MNEQLRNDVLEEAAKVAASSHPVQGPLIAATLRAMKRPVLTTYQGSLTEWVDLGPNGDGTMVKER
jgi:hypothetical protein